jgi:glycosyltransferase involved in cell wall biosynthesis
MAAGLPVVAHDIPSVREQVDHGRTGVLVPAPNDCDSTDCRHSTLSALVAEEGARAKLGTAARQAAVADRDWSPYIDLYRSVLERPPVRSADPARESPTISRGWKPHR